MIFISFQGHVKPTITQNTERWRSSIVRVGLLYSMLITWIAEVGYKLVTKQFIFVVRIISVEIISKIYQKLCNDYFGDYFG